PGLIEGAAKGAGLGLEFLRHVERTRVLVHLVDIQPGDGSDPAENYRVIREELRQHSQALYDKRELVELNKIDLEPDKKEREKLIKKLCRDLELRLDRDVIAISGATRENVTALLTRLWRELNPTDDVEGWKSEPLPA
ncbi:MAG: GTPase ObgE, partial [Phycisphaerae bacterium]